MSTIDLERFHATFFEESREGCEQMEVGLLSLDQIAEGEAIDLEVVNTIFRAAHSIKGGSSTFGFTELADLTHALETLLDEMRAGRRPVRRQETDVLLESVDVLRALLDARQHKRSFDAVAIEALKQRLDALLSDAEQPRAAASSDTADARSCRGGKRWAIRFAPGSDLLRTGNEPLRILRELAEMGHITVEADTGRIPPLASLEPDTAYMGWTIELDGDTTEAEVKEIFAWVEDECELDIRELPDSSSSPEAVEDKAAQTSAPGLKPVVTPAGASADAASIRVSIEKVDALINLVGELVITQAMLAQHGNELDPVAHEKLVAGLAQFERNTRDLQEAVMAVRMLPAGMVFSRFPRVVRDTAAKLGKSVQLLTSGETTELDKGVIERIVDPLTHLVRNSLDHGLETAQERKAAGKPETGTISIDASQQGGHILLVVKDDGRGLNREKLLAKARQQGIEISDEAPDSEVWPLVFLPGLSTAEKLSDVSGRGVGMDVVKKNIQALGGSLELSSSTGKGTTVLIRLPLTLAILDGMSVGVSDNIYILPLASVIESLQPLEKDIKTIADAGRLVRVRNEYLPLVDLRQWFSVGGNSRSPHEAIVVIVESEGRKLAVQVDELVGQQQVVIKSLEANYRRVRGVSGATILGDGRVSLILDVTSIIRLLSQPPSSQALAA